LILGVGLAVVSLAPLLVHFAHLYLGFAAVDVFEPSDQPLQGIQRRSEIVGVVVAELVFVHWEEEHFLVVFAAVEIVAAVADDVEAAVAEVGIVGIVGVAVGIAFADIVGIANVDDIVDEGNEKGRDNFVNDMEEAEQRVGQNILC
jgi:hypothetical protein